MRLDPLKYLIVATLTPRLSYNMAGHGKFCITLLLGFLLFHEQIARNQFLGILCTLCGIFLYSYFKLKEQAKLDEEKRLAQGSESLESNDKSSLEQVQEEEAKPKLST